MGWVTILVLIYFLLPIVLFLLVPSTPPLADLRRKKRAIVLVLGDLGHSPRMQNHAVCLARGNINVELCGYLGSPVVKELQENDAVNIHGIPIIQCPEWGKKAFILWGGYKVMLQHWYLLSLLWSLRKEADFLLVQNPPTIPTLAVCRFFVLFINRQTKLFIDWHNFGYAVLAMRLGKRHPLVWLAKIYEGVFSRRAFIHFSVSVTMARLISSEFRIRAGRILPLLDRPPQQFQPLFASERNEILTGNPIFTQNGFNIRTDKFIVTSTSFTTDEDLDLMLEALQIYNVMSESEAARNTKVPRLFVLVTGKGPGKFAFEQQVEKLDLKNICIKTAWLPIDEYPRIIGAADLGLSLHKSASGCDLPMKIVDLFGCGIPVVSLSFPAIEELVKPGENGMLVDNSSGLADELWGLLATFDSKQRLLKLKQGALRETKLRWAGQWVEKVGPLFGIGEYNNTLDDIPDESDSSDDDDHFI